METSRRVRLALPSRYRCDDQGDRLAVASSDGFVESFNGRLRDELLNETMFRSLAHAREVLSDWRKDYNGERPHTSLDGLTPNEFARRSTTDHNQDGLQL
jgi:putative transposase